MLCAAALSQGWWFSKKIWEVGDANKLEFYHNLLDDCLYIKKISSGYGSYVYIYGNVSLSIVSADVTQMTKLAEY